MTLIELWYFVALLGAPIAGALVGYQEGGFLLALPGVVVGVAIGAGTICGSMLPHLALGTHRRMGPDPAAEAQDWTLNLVLVTFTVCVFATPIIAVWLTVVCVQWIGNGWLA